jgi:hypothetical protein
MAILRHTAARVTAATAKDRELHSLEAHEPLANIVVGGWVDGAALGITKEFVQSIISGAFPNLVVVVQLLGLVDRIINRSVSGVLGRASIETGWSTPRMLLTVASVRPKCAVRILVSTRCSGKRLQVSDYCSTPVRTERNRVRGRGDMLWCRESVLTFAVLALIASSAVRSATVRLGRTQENRVIGVRLDVLLEILRTLESFTAEVALMWLQWHVNTDMRGNVIPLDSGCAASAPLASQVQVVCALAADMALTDVVLNAISDVREKIRCLQDKRQEQGQPRRYRAVMARLAIHGVNKLTYSCSAEGQRSPQVCH